MFLPSRDPNRHPGEASLNVWPIHTPNGKEYMELNSRFNNEPDTMTPIGRGPRANECAFWVDYLPQLIASTGRHEIMLQSVYVEVMKLY